MRVRASAGLRCAAALKAARCWSRFKSYSPLYQRVRADNIQRVKARPEEFAKRLDHLVAQTKAGRMYGDWDDFGRLSGDWSASRNDDPSVCQ